MPTLGDVRRSRSTVLERVAPGYCSASIGKPEWRHGRSAASPCPSTGQRASTTTPVGSRRRCPPRRPRSFATRCATVDGPTLEIGIGTGRVALPLVAAGQRLVGVDLSFAMLAKLREKSPTEPPLVQADATLLPFRDGTFGGAVVAHVLHLVSDWRVVVAELRRVVHPGGVLLVTRGVPRVRAAHGDHPTRARGRGLDDAARPARRPRRPRRLHPVCRWGGHVAGCHPDRRARPPPRTRCAPSRPT